MSEQPGGDAARPGISDEDLPEDLQPGEDNPLAEPLEPGEAPDVDLNEPSASYQRELEDGDAGDPAGSEPGDPGDPGDPGGPGASREA